MVNKASLCCLRGAICLCSNVVVFIWIALIILIFQSYTFGSPPSQIALHEIPSDSAFKGLSADSLSDAASYIWLQPTDIHIRDNNSESTNAFRDFCKLIVPYIKPT